MHPIWERSSLTPLVPGDLDSLWDVSEMSEEQERGTRGASTRDILLLHLLLRVVVSAATLSQTEREGSEEEA